MNIGEMGQICFDKFSITKCDRCFLIEKKTKFLEMKEKTKIAESILRYKFN
jgi:hypothetical protein